MNFSSVSLLKLQRLSRTVKKELNQSVSIRNKAGIGEVLRLANSENNSVPILEAKSDFISTLTEQDRAELILYNVFISSEVGSAGTSSEQSPSIINQDRRQINTPVDDDRRYYRGMLIEEDRRKQDIAHDSGDRRKVYRGVVIGEETGTNIVEQVVTEKKKPVRMYRGQPIYDDE